MSNAQGRASLASRLTKGLFDGVRHGRMVVAETRMAMPICSHTSNIHVCAREPLPVNQRFLKPRLPWPAKQAAQSNGFGARRIASRCIIDARNVCKIRIYHASNRIASSLKSANHASDWVQSVALRIVLMR